jgi:hypothetical protein
MNCFIKRMATCSLAVTLTMLIAGATYTISSPPNEINNEASFVGAGMSNDTPGTRGVFSVFKYQAGGPEGQFLGSRSTEVGTTMNWYTLADVVSPPSGGWPIGQPALAVKLESGDFTLSKVVSVAD